MSIEKSQYPSNQIWQLDSLTLLTFLTVKILKNFKTKTAAAAIFKIRKSSYLSNGLTDRLYIL